MQPAFGRAGLDGGKRQVRRKPWFDSGHDALLHLRGGKLQATSCAEKKAAGGARCGHRECMKMTLVRKPLRPAATCIQCDFAGNGTMLHGSKRKKRFIECLI
jgi:hypothetical protein